MVLTWWRDSVWFCKLWLSAERATAEPWGASKGSQQPTFVDSQMREVLMRVQHRLFALVSPIHWKALSLSVFLWRLCRWGGPEMMAVAHRSTMFVHIPWSHSSCWQVVLRLHVFMSWVSDLLPLQIFLMPLKNVLMLLQKSYPVNRIRLTSLSAQTLWRGCTEMNHLTP